MRHFYLTRDKRDKNPLEWFKSHFYLRRTLFHPIECWGPTNRETRCTNNRSPFCQCPLYPNFEFLIILFRSQTGYKWLRCVCKTDNKFISINSYMCVWSMSRVRWAHTIYPFSELCIQHRNSIIKHLALCAKFENVFNQNIYCCMVVNSNNVNQM